jgi:hypothetical protein
MRDPSRVQVLRSSGFECSLWAGGGTKKPSLDDADVRGVVHARSLQVDLRERQDTAPFNEIIRATVISPLGKISAEPQAA